MHDPVPWLILVDFDGTITARDADFVIADAARGPAAARVYGPLAELCARDGIAFQPWEGFDEIGAALLERIG